MNYLELAIEAKRNKKFSLAIRYYQKQILKEGPSTKVLQSAAKTYYLNNQKPLSVKFNLAAAHLYLHKEFEKFKNGDKKVTFYLDEISKASANQFPHMIGDLLYYYEEHLNHLAHSYIDNDSMYKREPKLKKYAEIYYAQLLGDGSEEAKFKTHDLTESELRDVENEHYIPVAYELATKEIKWTEIENCEVLRLYVK